MAQDGKNPSPEGIKNPGAGIQNPERARILEQAKARINALDVASDGVHDDPREREAKAQAIEFVSTACLDLPNDRLVRLVDEIRLRMEQRDAYRENLMDGFREARVKIIRETEGTRSTQAGNRILDRLNETFGYDRQLVRKCFDPRKVNAEAGANYLEHLSKDPSGSNGFAKLMAAITEEDVRIAGFLTHWNSKHPVYLALKKANSERALEMVTNVEERLRERFGVSREMAEKFTVEQERPASKGFIPDIESLYSTDETARVTVLDIVRKKNAAKNGEHKYWEWGNVIADRADGMSDKARERLRRAGSLLPKFIVGESVELERKIFAYRFQDAPGVLDKKEFQSYVERSANYLEYVVQGKGEKAFLEKMRQNPEMLAHFLKKWSVSHPINRALTDRGLADVSGRIMRIRSEFMKEMKLTEAMVAERDCDEITEIVRTGEIKKMRFENSAKVRLGWEAFGAKSLFSPKDLALLVQAAKDRDQSDWEVFALHARSNVDNLKNFLLNWPNCPLAEALKNVAGGEIALAKIAAMRAKWMKEYGIREGGSRTELEKEIEKVGKSEREAKRKEFLANAEPQYVHHKETVLFHMRSMTESLLRLDNEKIEKTKKTLTDFSDGTLTKLLNEANALFPGNEGGKRDPIVEKIVGLRLAIEALRDLKLPKMEDGLWKTMKSAIQTQQLKTLAEVKTQQVESIIAGKHSTVMSFRSEYGGLNKIWGIDSADNVNAKILNKQVRPEEVNPDVFAGMIVQAYVSGNMTRSYFESKWGKDTLTEMALYWGGSGGDESRKTMRRRLDLRLRENGRGHMADEFVAILNSTIAVEDQKTKRVLDEMKNANRERIATMADDIAKRFPKIEKARITATILEINDKKPERTEDIIRIIARNLGDGVEIKAEHLREILSCLIGEAQRDVEAAKRKAKETDYPGKTFGETRIFQEDFVALAKSPEETKLIEKLKTVKVDNFSVEECRKVLEMLKRIPDGEKTLFFKYLNARLEKRSAEVRKEGSKKIRDSAEVVTDMMRKRREDPSPEGRKKWDEQVSKYGKAVDAAVQESVNDQDYLERKDRIDAESARVLEEIGMAGVGVNEVLADKTLCKKVATLLEKHGKTDTDLYRLVSAKLELSAYVEAYEREYGGKLNLTPSDGKEKGFSEAGEKTAERSKTGDTSFTRTFEEARSGETFRLSDGTFGTKTASGGLEISTVSGKLRFDHKEAEGALQQIDLLKAAGAEFLIPAIREIAGASGVDFKAGLSRLEIGRVLSTLARTFGFDSVANEADPMAMLSKFKAAASGAANGKTVEAVARNMGVITKWNTVDREILERVMTGQELSREFA